MSSPGLCFLAVPVLLLVLPAFLPLRLPHPYEQFTVLPLTPEFTRRSAFNASISSRSPVQFASDRGAPLLHLTETSTRRMFGGLVQGAESVAVLYNQTSQSQKLIMIDKYGFVRTAQFIPDERSYEMSNESLYIGPGRSLGFHVYSATELIVCDSVKGLLAVDIGTERLDFQCCGDRIRVLTNSVTSTEWKVSNVINYANDLDILNDEYGNDIVYFTSSTTYGTVAFNAEEQYFDTMRSFLLTLLAGDVSGRLLEYNMTSKRTTVLMKDIYYANGVAISPDNSYVLVVETVGLRVWKYFLNGPKRGQREIFLADLPGFPDGITLSKDKKSFYVSVVAPLSPIFSTGSRVMQSPFARWLSAWILVSYSPLLSRLGVLKKVGCVVRVNAATEVVENVLLDATGEIVSTISAVTDTPKQLLFGNLGGDAIYSWDKE